MIDAPGIDVIDMRIPVIVNDTPSIGVPCLSRMTGGGTPDLQYFVVLFYIVESPGLQWSHKCRSFKVNDLAFAPKRVPFKPRL